MKTKTINLNKIEEELAGLTMLEIREQFAELYGYTTSSKCRRHVVKKILWAVQREVHGDISEPLKIKALTIADDRDVRERFPNRTLGTSNNGDKSLTLPFKPKPELLPGTVLHKTYKDEHLRVLVLEKGFEWDGQYFKSLSATARAITGTRWNGLLFFGLK